MEPNGDEGQKLVAEAEGVNGDQESQNLVAEGGVNGDQESQNLVAEAEVKTQVTKMEANNEGQNLVAEAEGVIVAEGVKGDDEGQNVLANFISDNEAADFSKLEEWLAKGEESSETLIGAVQESGDDEGLNVLANFVSDEAADFSKLEEWLAKGEESSETLIGAVQESGKGKQHFNFDFFPDDFFPEHDHQIASNDLDISDYVLEETLTLTGIEELFNFNPEDYRDVLGEHQQSKDQDQYNPELLVQYLHRFINGLLDLSTLAISVSDEGFYKKTPASLFLNAAVKEKYYFVRRKFIVLENGARHYVRDVAEGVGEDIKEGEWRRSTGAKEKSIYMCNWMTGKQLEYTFHEKIEVDQNQKLIPTSWRMIELLIDNNHVYPQKEKHEEYAACILWNMEAN